MFSAGRGVFAAAFLIRSNMRRTGSWPVGKAPLSWLPRNIIWCCFVNDWAPSQDARTDVEGGRGLEEESGNLLPDSGNRGRGSCLPEGIAGAQAMASTGAVGGIRGRLGAVRADNGQAPTWLASCPFDLSL